MVGLGGILLQHCTLYVHKMSPFMALYGRSLLSLVRLSNNVTLVDSLEQWLKERDAILDVLCFHLL